jgi:hypothetical protein
MPIPKEITDILSELGLPAGAIALAIGLVRGARTLEKDASDRALKYVSGLLIGGDATSFGKIGATLVPAIFDRIFGSRPLSYKFISRSLLAPTLFWIILLAVKHPNWRGVWNDLITNDMYRLLIPWFIVDWISLVKARFLIKVILIRSHTLLFTTLFVSVDLLISYLLPLLSSICVFGVFINFHPGTALYDIIHEYLILVPITDYYLFESGQKICSRM